MKRILKNTTLDDISAVIGFSATIRLSAWVAGEDPQGFRVFIPESISADHMLAKLLGLHVAEKLCKEWPGEWLDVPSLSQLKQIRFMRQVARLFELGESARGIARATSLTKRRVEQIRHELMDAGLLAENAPGKTPSTFSDENAQEKEPQENPLYFFPTSVGEEA